jgi:mRNA interferase HigB
MRKPCSFPIHHWIGMEISNIQASCEFIRKHSQAKSPLERFLRIVRRSDFANLNHVRETFPHADAKGKKVIFNIGGNKYRLEAFIDYRSDHKTFRILKIMTHDEYSKNIRK